MKINDNIKILILNAAHHVVTVLAAIVPKKKDSIMIYGFRLFDDNSKALYQFLRDHGYNEKYSIFCCAKNVDEFQNENRKNIVFSSNLFRILWAHIRSRYIFYSISTVFTNTPTKRQTVVNMWHGGPLKKIGYLDNAKQWRKLSSIFTYLCVTSEYFAPVMKKCFACRDEQIIINGHPRCDDLFGAPPLPEKLVDSKRYKKIFLWMPTYRNDGRGKSDSAQSFPILTRSNIGTLNDWLSRNESLLIIKPHQLQIKLDLFEAQQSNILIVGNQAVAGAHMKLYSLLANADALVTDYSSVYYDYLLLDRPIAFTIDDIQSYAENRGFAVDIFQIMPGEKINDLEQLIQFFGNVLEGNDEFAEERKRVDALVNDRKRDFSKYLLERIGIRKN